MKIKVDISVGELLDKISILKIKCNKIEDEKKLMYVKAELLDLVTCATSQGVLDEDLLSEIQTVNEALWDIEDEIRILEKNKDFSTEFVNLARSVYITNDERFEIKSRINEKYGSMIREQKQYTDYGG
jgi:hypothetical protein